MNLLHEKVRHAVFGSGEIIAQSDTMITVRFHADQSKRKFLYPQAFDQYLALSNPAFLPALEQELDVLHAQAMAQKQMLEAQKKAEQMAWKAANPGPRGRKTTRKATPKQ